ncbi:phage tail tape measure protein [Enterococcus cecorum]|uniref:phage tail tape measure protein n=1 Tax=Enterococcus cecorum TaxID=44008 RepID=UPI00148CD5E5
MADRVKGITIEIDGNTQGLDKALKSVNDKSVKLNRELKDVNKLLKFDPGNAELVAQKQKLLSEQVENTKTKLNALKRAQEQVEQQFQSGKIDEGQYRNFQREVASTEQSLRSYESQLKNLESSQTALGQNTKRLETFFEASKTSVDDYADILGNKLTQAIKGGYANADQLEVAINKIGREFTEGKTDVSEFKRVLDSVDDGNSIDNVKNDLNELKPAINDASDSVEKMSKVMSADVMADVSQGFADAGQKVIEFGQNALDAFSVVDEGLDTIITKTGASGETMSGFEEIYKNIGSSMAVELPKVGEAIGEVNTQLGFQGKALEEASKQAIEFSEINGQDITSSVLNAKQVLSAYSLENDKFANVLDTVTVVAQATGQSTSDLLKKVTDGAPQVKALGLSFEQGTTLIGNFEKAGVDSSAALSSLSKAAVNYAKDGKTLSQGLQETVDKIKNSKDETEQLTLASDVFGTKAAPRMVDAIKRGALNFDEMAKAAENTSGAVANTYEATLDPIDQFTVAQNNLSFVMADFGSVIAEVLAPMLQTVSDVLQVIANAFGNLPGPVKQVIVVVGLVTAAMGMLMPIIMGIQLAMAAAGTTLAGLITAALPVVGIIAGIIAAVTAVILVIQNWGTIVDWLNEHFSGFMQIATNVWQTIQNVVQTAIQAVSDFIMQIFGTVVSWWQENQTLIQNATQVAWDFIQNVISIAMSVIGPIVQAGFNIVMTIVQTVWSFITTYIQTAINVVLGVIKAVMQIITGDWQGAWDTIKNVISTVWNAIKSNVSTAINAVSSIISSVWNTIKSVTTTVWNGIKSAITGPINAAKDAVSRGINAIKNLFNFKISWPHIPLPHFRVSGSANPLDWLKGKVPSIGIDWYAKGGILTRPTVFGMNGNNLMVGGEAGKEAVAPLSDLMAYVRQAVRDEVGNNTELFMQMISLLTVIANKDLDIYLNANKINEEIEKIQTRNENRWKEVRGV